VLAAGSVLGEEAGPVLGEGVDVTASLTRRPIDLVRQDLGHGELALPDQIRVPVGTGDTELVHGARERNKVSVTEVKTEEIGVRRLRKSQGIPNADRTGCSRALEVRPATPPPVADGASGYASSSGYLTVVQARSNKV